MNSTSPLVCFAHGKESGPWGRKIVALSDIAQQRGFDVISPDYSHTHDPDQRVQQLLNLAPKGRPLVLVGSSMGGYVSAMACAELQPDALFLMAPALYFPGWDTEPQGIPSLCSVVHGWNDEIVPHERGLRFAQHNRAALHLIDSDHGLLDRLNDVCALFEQLLGQVQPTSP